LANKAGDDIDDKINCDYELDEMEKLLKSWKDEDVDVFLAI
jgi:hypothetical protein